jgi:isochorismate pyruvate lyase
MAEPDPHAPPVRRFRDPGYVPVCTNLAEIRANIDRLDREIVRLLAERGRYVKDATRFKRDGSEVAAPQRQQAVFDQVVALAHAHGAYPEVVEATYRAIVAGFVAREQSHFAATESIE